MTAPEPAGRHASPTLSAARARTEPSRQAGPRYPRQRPRLTPDLRDQISAQFTEGTYCTLCSGIHPGLSMPACPRVSSFERDADGKLRAATFWADGDWDASGVYFASDAEAGDEPPSR